MEEVVWEYPGKLLVRYSTLAHNSYGPNGNPGNKSFGSYGIMLQGTKGKLFIDRAGYEITPQMRMNREAVSQTDREAYDDLLGAGLYFTSEGAAEKGATSMQHLPHVAELFGLCEVAREAGGRHRDRAQEHGAVPDREHRAADGAEAGVGREGRAVYEQ